MRGLAYLAALLIAGTPAAGAAPRSESTIPELDSLIVANMDAGHVPGLSARAFRNGDVIWGGDFGYADIEQGVAVTDSTLFMLASVSKTVTGCALMQLWEANAFELDDDIDDYLPFSVDNPWYPGIPVTFEMLLTHTSSIRDDRDVFDAVTVPGDSPMSLGGFLESYLTPGGQYYDPNLNYIRDWAPGAAREYCNVGIALVGYLVERIAGVGFAEYCERYVFDALAMDETSWFLASLDTSRVAQPYQWNGDAYVPYAHYGYPFYPAGQLRTTASQLAFFLAVFAEEGQGILEPETAELMTTVHYPPDQGLIWFRTEMSGYTGWYHTGGHYGVSTYALVVPELRSGMVILTNGEFTLNAIRLFIWNYVFQQALDVKEEVRRPIARLTPNAPNPFRSETTIRFDLETAGPATLRVYDVTGRAVATLVDGILPSGRHSAVFEARQLPPGVYLFRLQTDGGVVAQKGTVLR